MPVSRNICLINFENRLGDFQSKCSGGRRFCNFKVNVPWRNTLFFPATLHGPCQKPAREVFFFFSLFIISSDSISSYFQSLQWVSRIFASDVWGMMRRSFAFPHHHCQGFDDAFVDMHIGVFRKQVQNEPIANVTTVQDVLNYLAVMIWPHSRLAPAKLNKLTHLFRLTPSL